MNEEEKRLAAEFGIDSDDDDLDANIVRKTNDFGPSAFDKVSKDNQTSINNPSPKNEMFLAPYRTTT